MINKCIYFFNSLLPSHSESGRVHEICPSVKGMLQPKVMRLFLLTLSECGWGPQSETENQL